MKTKTREQKCRGEGGAGSLGRAELRAHLSQDNGRLTAFVHLCLIASVIIFSIKKNGTLRPSGEKREQKKERKRLSG